LRGVEINQLRWVQVTFLPAQYVVKLSFSVKYVIFIADELLVPRSSPVVCPIGRSSQLVVVKDDLIVALTALTLLDFLHCNSTFIVSLHTFLRLLWHGDFVTLVDYTDDFHAYVLPLAR